METVRQLRDGEELVLCEDSTPASFRLDDLDPRAETVERRLRALSARAPEALRRPPREERRAEIP